MTTIACDGKTMVSDGMITTGDVTVETTRQKVHRLKDGRLVGFAGNAYNWKPVLDYFNHKNPKKAQWPKIVGSNSILVLERDGRCVIYDADGRTFERTPPLAVGSGWMFAIGAMDAGMSPLGAVHIASKRDIATGGKTFTLNLNDPTLDAV